MNSKASKRSFNKKISKKTNPYAKTLTNPKYKTIVKVSKKIYNRKKKSFNIT